MTAAPVLAAAPKAAKAKGQAKVSVAEAASASLKDLCTLWMDKLATRERDNIKHIRWDNGADSVQGTYIGYSKEHTCNMIEGTEDDPVAKIRYREVRYKKEGRSLAEAEQSTPEPVEIFEVQEIFHYHAGKGRWDY